MPGIQIDLLIFAAVGVVLVTAVVAWVGIAASRERAPQSVRPSTITGAVLAWLSSGASLAGARFAIARNVGRGGSVAAKVCGFALAACGVAGAITFATSLNRLVTDGARFGSNYDLMVGNGYSRAGNDSLAALKQFSDVTAMMLLGSVEGRVEDATVQLVGFEQVSGALAPRVIDGRLPASSDEIALGGVTADELDVGIGDELTLTGATGAASYRIVGQVVVPSIGVNNGVGEGGLMTLTAAPTPGFRVCTVGRCHQISAPG